MPQHFDILLGTVNLKNKMDIQKLHHSEARKWWELNRVGPKVYQAWEVQ